MSFNKSDMPRLLFDHTAFVMYRYGGVSRYFTELIKRLAYRLPVECFMGFYINQYGLEHSRRQMARFKGLARLNVRRTHQLSLMASDLAFSGFARNSEAQIYHATSYTAHLKRFFGKRVFTFHDMTAQRVPQFFPNWQIDLQAKQASAALASGVICVSEATRRDVIERLGIPESLTRVIYHANSLTETPDSRHPEPEPFVLFVGMRQTYKNFEAVLAAWATNQRLRGSSRLVCFGRPPTTEEIARIAAMGLTKRVRFISGDDRLLATYYAHAEAFVYPSLAEGFGIPLLEAMHYGCPVVASRIPCFEEVAGNAATYFNPQDSGELASVLLNILGDNKQRKTLAHAGYLCEQRYSWERVTSETVAFYQRVVS